MSMSNTSSFGGGGYVATPANDHDVTVVDALMDGRQREGPFMGMRCIGRKKWRRCCGGRTSLHGSCSSAVSIGPSRHINVVRIGGVPRCVCVSSMCLPVARTNWAINSSAPSGWTRLGANGLAKLALQHAPPSVSSARGDGLNNEV